jgi:hypothetical protein
VEGLGRLFDINIAFAPVDLNTAGGAGLLTDLSNAAGVTFVVLLGAQASGTETEVLTVREAQDGSATGEQDLDVVDHYYIKKEATLDGEETWALVTQTAGDITIAGADRDKQCIIAFYVSANQLSDGFTHVTVDAGDPGAVARLGAGIAILHDLVVQRDPAKLAAPQQ